jgi:hypothetical protein
METIFRIMKNTQRRGKIKAIRRTRSAASTSAPPEEIPYQEVAEKLCQVIVDGAILCHNKRLSKHDQRLIGDARQYLNGYQIGDKPAEMPEGKMKEFVDAVYARLQKGIKKLATTHKKGKNNSEILEIVLREFLQIKEDIGPLFEKHIMDKGLLKRACERFADAIATLWYGFLALFSDKYKSDVATVYSGDETELGKAVKAVGEVGEGVGEMLDVAKQQTSLKDLHEMLKNGSSSPASGKFKEGYEKIEEGLGKIIDGSENESEASSEASSETSSETSSMATGRRRLEGFPIGSLTQSFF